jgi:hypothetical protein
MNKIRSEGKKMSKDAKKLAKEISEHEGKEKGVYARDAKRKGMKMKGKC